MIIENFTFNKIIVIESLSEKERKTGKELFDDVLKRRQYQMPKEFEVEYHEVQSLEQLHQLLIGIQNQVKGNDLVPVLHFELHGSEHGLHLNSGEVLTWEQLLSVLQAINIVTKNNLLVTFASCFSTYVLKSLNLKNKSPFWSLVSSNYEIYPEEIYVSYSNFYDTLLTERSFERAVEALNTYNEGKIILRFINAETLLYEKVFQSPEVLQRLEDEGVAEAMRQDPEAFNNDPEFARKILRFWYSQRAFMYTQIMKQFAPPKK
jgi:hypothetical protein